MKTAGKLPRASYPIAVTDPTTNNTVTYTVQNDMFTVGAGYLNLDAALAASVFHSGEIAIPNLKQALRSAGIEVRL